MKLLAFIIVIILIIAFKLYMDLRTTETILDDDEKDDQTRRVKVRIFSNQYSHGTLKARKDCLFLYGDNEDHAGRNGQAIIRDEPNTAGIVTKRRPYMNEDSFYDDNDYESNIASIDNSFDDAVKRINQNSSYKFVMIPVAGLGTGLAQLPSRSPKTFLYILQKLYDLTFLLDPDSLNDSVGEWIQKQTQIVKNVPKKRITV